METINLKTYIIKYIRKALFVLIIAILASLFIPTKLFILMILTTFLNIRVAKLNIMSNLPTEFELSTFSTVIISSIFGLKYGFFNAIFSKIIANIYNAHFIPDHFFMIINYCIAAIIAFYFRGLNILSLGMLITLINNLTMFFISKYILSISLPHNLSYVSTNIIFNFLVFLIMGNYVYRIFS